MPNRRKYVALEGGWTYIPKSSQPQYEQWTKRNRPYTVCEACGNWVWSSRWKTECNCGHTFGTKPVQKVPPAAEVKTGSEATEAISLVKEILLAAAAADPAKQPMLQKFITALQPPEVSNKEHKATYNLKIAKENLDNTHKKLRQAQHQNTQHQSQIDAAAKKLAALQQGQAPLLAALEEARRDHHRALQQLAAIVGGKPARARAANMDVESDTDEESIGVPTPSAEHSGPLIEEVHEEPEPAEPPTARHLDPEDSDKVRELRKKLDEALAEQLSISNENKRRRLAEQNRQVTAVAEEVTAAAVAAAAAAVSAIPQPAGEATAQQLQG